MRLLLGTNIWLWSDSEPHKLSSEVYQAITDGRNSRSLSPLASGRLSFSLLLEARKIANLQDFGQWLERTRSELELQGTMLDSKVVHEMRFTMLGTRPGGSFPSSHSSSL
jgi:PIN domain nuclease of toxin-antitoxin system